jgi:hypothetical protein
MKLKLEDGELEASLCYIDLVSRRKEKNICLPEH